jgi:hypothetical protein
MANFPSLKAPTAFSESIQKKQIKTPFENGYVQSRAIWTRARRKFSLSWDNLPYAQLYGTGMLLDHFTGNVGDTFTFTHPLTSEAVTARYSDDELSYERTKIPGYYKVSLNLEEV